MNRLAIAAALTAAVLVPAEAGAAAECYSPAVVEAEQAVRFIVEVMVASTACRDQTYGMFQQRNKEAVLHYQNTMISHLHGRAAYDKWDTALANSAAMKQAGKTAPQSCQEAAELLKSAGAMDNKGFRAFAVTQATAAVASGRYPKCGR